MKCSVRVLITGMFIDTALLEDGLNKFIEEKVEGPNGVLDLDIKIVSNARDPEMQSANIPPVTVYFAIMRYIPKIHEPLTGSGGELH
jgi:hypothetical protein